MILMLHGWGGEGKLWEYFADKITGTILVPDLPGFGYSPPPDAPYTLDNYVDEVVKLITDHSTTKAIVVGHSFGGRIAIRLSSRFPQLVRALVLTDAAGMKPRRSIRYRFNRLKYHVYRTLELNTEFMGSVDYKNVTGVMRRTLVNVVNTFLEKDASKISIDTLIVWGRQDMETPLYMAKRLNKLIAKSALIVLDGCGHYAYLERAREFSKILRAFVEGIIYE